MDHLWLPSDSTGTVSKVRYLETERYDGGLFLGYTERRNRPGFQVAGEDPNSFRSLVGRQTDQLHHRTSTSESMPFLQTWLFFGLLAECFGCASAESLNPDDLAESVGWATPWVYHQFIQDEEGVSYITTQKLPHLLQESWVKPLANWTRDTVMKKCDHLG